MKDIRNRIGQLHLVRGKLIRLFAKTSGHFVQLVTEDGELALLAVVDQQRFLPVQNAVNALRQRGDPIITVRTKTQMYARKAEPKQQQQRSRKRMNEKADRAQHKRCAEPDQQFLFDFPVSKKPHFNPPDSRVREPS